MGLPLFATIGVGSFERPRPDSSLCCLRSGFGRNVVAGVLAIGGGVTAFDHRGIDVRRAHRAAGDGSIILIGRDQPTPQLPTCDQARKVIGRLRAASSGSTLASAGLIKLGGIDTEKPDLAIANHQGVSVL